MRIKKPKLFLNIPYFQTCFWMDFINSRWLSCQTFFPFHWIELRCWANLRVKDITDPFIYWFLFLRYWFQILKILIFHFLPPWANFFPDFCSWYSLSHCSDFEEPPMIPELSFFLNFREINIFWSTLLLFILSFSTTPFIIDDFESLNWYWDSSKFNVFGLMFSFTALPL